MIHPIERQIDQLVGLQLKTFQRQGALSEPELAECMGRFDLLKQLYRDLDCAKELPRAPWSTFERVA